VLSARRTITREVGPEDLATALYPTVCKPPVLATARLLQWCELAVMKAMDGCVVGTDMAINHLAPVVLGASVVIDATCIRHDGPRTAWEIQCRDAFGRFATAYLAFQSIDLERYTARRVQPKLAMLGG
jgi:predicted thioesterase